MVTRARPAAPPRLLLVDEIEADRSLASVVLSQAFPDCELRQVSDGGDLFTELKSGTFDLVVTELGVREASWAFVLDAIRALQPQAPIVVFSSQADRDAQLEVLNAGAATFVVKSTQGYLDLKMAVGRVLGHEVDGHSTPPAKGALPVAGVEARAEETAREEIEAPSRGRAREDGWVEVHPGGSASGGEPASTPSPPPQAEQSHRPEVEPYFDEDDSAQLPAPMATFVARAQKVLSGPLRQALAILGSVIVVSALISFLVSSVTRDAARSASVEGDTQATGVVLGAHVTDEEEASENPPTVATPNSAPAPETTLAESTAPNVTPPLEPNTQTPAPPFKGTMPVTLEIRANEEVWVLVTLDGKDVLDATLQPGASHIFQGQWVAGLRVGNAAGLQVFWNGQDIGRIGREGQVRRLYFTRDDVGAGAPPDPVILSRP
jgi:DNA-binding NarL/FixJ family response regulator